MFPNFSNSLACSCNSKRSIGGASPLIGSVIVYDQTRSALTRNICPDPLNEHGHAQTGCRQELQVHGCPCKPSQEAAQMDLSCLQNGEPFPDNRHVALIEIFEWFRRGSANNAFVNQLARVSALLKGHLSDSRERFAVLIERCCVADYKDFGVSWNADV